MRFTAANVAAVTLTVAGVWTSAGMAHAEPEPAPPPPPKTNIDADGTYKVGVDIQPGAYTSAGPIEGGACYWKRVQGGKTVDNALTKKPQVVKIDPADTAFTTHDCQPWQLTDCAKGGCPAPPGLSLSSLAPLLQFLGPQIAQGGPG